MSKPTETNVNAGQDQNQAIDQTTPVRSLDDEPIVPGAEDFGDQPQPATEEPAEAPATEEPVADFDLGAFLGVPVLSEPLTVEHQQPTITNNAFRQIRRPEDKTMVREAYQLNMPDGAGGSHKEGRTALLEGYRFQTHRAPTKDWNKPMTELHTQAMCEALGYELQVETYMEKGQARARLKTDEQGRWLLKDPRGTILWDENNQPVGVTGAAPVHLYTVITQIQRDSGFYTPKFMSKDGGCILFTSKRRNPDGTTREVRENWNVDENFHLGLKLWRDELRAASQTDPKTDEPEAMTRLRNFAMEIPAWESASESEAGLQRIIVGNTPEPNPALSTEQIAKMLTD